MCVPLILALPLVLFVTSKLQPWRNTNLSLSVSWKRSIHLLWTHNIDIQKSTTMVCSMLLESLSCSSFTVLPDPVWVLLIYVLQNIPLSLHNSKSLKLLDLWLPLFWDPLCSNYKTPPRGAPGRADMQATALLPKGLRFREARPVVELAFPGPNHRVGMNMTTKLLAMSHYWWKKIVIHLVLKLFFIL